MRNKKLIYNWWAGSGGGVILTSDASAPQADTFEVTATFPSATPGIVLGDFLISNVYIENLATADNIVYTFDATPIAVNGYVTIRLNPSIASSNTLSIAIFDPVDLTGAKIVVDTLGSHDLVFDPTDRRTVKNLLNRVGNGYDPTAPGTSYLDQPYVDVLGKYIRQSQDGLRRLELTDDLAQFTGDSQGEFIFAYQRPTTNSHAPLFMLGTTSADNYIIFYHAANNAGSGPSRFQVRRVQGASTTAVGGATINDANWHIVSVKTNGSTWIIYYDDGSGNPVEQTLTVTAGSNAGHWLNSITSPNTIQIGGWRTSITSRNTDSQLGALYYTTAPLSDADRATVFKRLHHLYKHSRSLGTIGLKFAIAGDPHVPVDKDNGRDAITVGLNAIEANVTPAPDQTFIVGDFYNEQRAVELPGDQSDGQEIASQLNSNSTIVRDSIATLAGNHDAGAGNYNAYDTYIDDFGVNTITSGCDSSNFTFPRVPLFTGSRAYYMDFGNIRVFMMPDRNDVDEPRGFDGALSVGGYPSGTMLESEWNALKANIQANKTTKQFIIMSHHSPRYTTIGTPDTDGVDGGFNGVSGISAGSGSLYSIHDVEDATDQFMEWLEANPDHNVNAWISGHVHIDIDELFRTRGQSFVRHGVLFKNVANLTRYHVAGDVKFFELAISGQLARWRTYCIEAVGSGTPTGWVASQEFTIPLKLAFKP